MGERKQVDGACIFVQAMPTHQEEAVGLAGAGQVEAAAAGGDMTAQSGTLGAALLALEAAAAAHLGRQPFQSPLCLMHLS